MKVFIAAIDSVKFSSKSELSSRFFGRLKFSESNFCETLNGRLPLEDGSDRRETLPKRVSDDSRHLIFRCNFFFLDEIFAEAEGNFVQMAMRKIMRVERNAEGKFSFVRVRA